MRAICSSKTYAVANVAQTDTRLICFGTQHTCTRAGPLQSRAQLDEEGEDDEDAHAGYQYSDAFDDKAIAGNLTTTRKMVGNSGDNFAKAVVQNFGECVLLHSDLGVSAARDLFGDSIVTVCSHQNGGYEYLVGSGRSGSVECTSLFQRHEAPITAKACRGKHSIQYCESEI